MNAEQIITDLRDMIGDPVYSTEGLPQPGMDGQFLRAQTIVRWINQAQAILGQVMKGIEDWTAFPGAVNQDVYTLDPRFFNLEAGILCYDGWQTDGPPLLAEKDVMPIQNLMTGLTLGWAISRTAPPLRIRVWPTPDRTPGTTYLATSIGPDDTTIPVVNASGMGVPGAPNYGWLRIGKRELVRYQLLSANTFSLVTRGEGGTRAVAHNSGTYVEEANIWVKGHRLPTPVGLPSSGTNDPVAPLSDPAWQPGSYTLTLIEQMELPDYTFHLIVEWCLRRARIKENDQQAADALLANFDRELKATRAAQRRPRIGQARVAGAGGGLWGGRVIIP